MFIASVMPSSFLILWCPLLLLPSIFSSIRDFSNELAVCIRWPKYWSFRFSSNPSNEYSGLISLKVDCFDFLAVQGTYRSLLQHHSSKASILWCSAFFKVQLSQPFMTTRKTIALTHTCTYILTPGGSDSKESAFNVGDPGSIPGSGKSYGEGNGKLLQYSCLENSIDRGTRWATIHRVTKNWIWLSN